MIKLSIIIPVYNVEEYLRQCLDSVINQTFKDIEIVLVDDGSTDNSGYICDKYASMDNRVKIIHKENRGVFSARNTGLNIATGKYIGFVDGDDYIRYNMFEKLINKAFETNADIVSCNFYRFYDKENLLISSNNSTQIKALEKSSFNFTGAEEIFLDDAFIWNRIYKKKLLIENNICFDRDIFYMEDVLFHRHALLFSKKIVYISDVLYFYRQQRKEAQTTLKDKRIFVCFEICDKLYNLINKKQLTNVMPWMNHLIISLLCLGYERIEYKYKDEYFEKFYDFFTRYNINTKSPMAFPKIFDNNIFTIFYCRYLVLRILHPLSIFFVLNKNKFLFNILIKIRILLSKIPFYIKFLLKKINPKN